MVDLSLLMLVAGRDGAIMRLEAATADWRADDDHLR